MTRFARAKGSKSSNEKKPEAATSWLEMKSAMLSQKLNKPDKTEDQEKEEVKNNHETKKTEWASLGGDDFGESVSLIKQHMGKKSDGSEKIKKDKTKKKISNNSQKELNSEEKSKSEKKNKKSKVVESVGIKSELEEKKEGKKRKFPTEVDSQVPKKKKKLSKTNGLEETKIEKNEDTNHKKAKKQLNENSQKIKNVKHMKNKNNRKENFKSNMKDKQNGGKKFKNKNFKEEKPQVEDLIINGEKIPIVKFQGFYVTLEDAERLKKLRSEMKNQGIPRAKLEAAIKLERRRAEKALSRLKKSVCFHCRGHGHLLSNCPKLLEKENTGTGICYKCGSTEHSAIECKVVRGTNYQFAECFICKEQGHIARQCPDNPRGLYPQGGACRECGDVTHLRKDCPKIQTLKAEEVVTVGVRSDRDLECLDEEIANREKQNLKKNVKRNSTVKF